LDGTGDACDDDDDGDGLPDIWELSYGLDPLDDTLDNGSDGDPDGDGITNYEEYVSGTEPDNGTSTPLEVTEVIPHDNAGIAPDDTRVPDNTSFAVRISADAGVDIDDPATVSFAIDEDGDGNVDYSRNLGSDAVMVTKLTTEDNSQVSEFWAVYHRAGETAPSNVYDFETTVEITVDVMNTLGVDLQQSHAFAIESQTEHDNAEMDQVRDPNYDDPDYVNPESVELTSGASAGCLIIYEESEVVKPTFGPTDELPPFDVGDADAAGVAVNFQPPTVFATSVKVIIPFPAGTDVTTLSLYLFNGTDWVPACDASGNILPGGDGCLVSNSRVNNDPAAPQPNIAIKMRHFTGIQGAAAIKAEDIAAPTPTPAGATTDLGGSGGGGGCFVETAGHGFKVGSLLACFVGLIAATCLSLGKMKIPA
jgi:hypothetical protein